MTIDELIVEALAARDRFWFVQTLQVRERTDALEHHNGLVQDLIKVIRDPPLRCPRYHY